MNLPPFADAFIPLLKQHKLIDKRETAENYKLIQLSLFADLLEADKYIQNTTITTTDYTYADQLTVARPISDNNRFFPKAIRKYIQTTPYSLSKYSCPIADRTNNVYVYTFVTAGTERNTLNIKKSHITLLFTWLCICIKYAQQKCAKELNIHIYLTPFKKTLPTTKSTVLSAEHVNTAFTYCCKPVGDITIFRAEEWFKVFLHESFHAYNLDFGLAAESTVLRKLMDSAFPIKSDYNINEAYTETWARIINCALFSFATLQTHEKTLAQVETFRVYMDFSLQLERLFSLYQMNKILNFMGLNYADISSPKAFLKQHLYKEDTHVFGYYILTALFLSDYQAFMQWCLTNNSAKNPMKFQCQSESFQKMGVYIQGIYSEPTLLQTIAGVKTLCRKPPMDLTNTTRMALIDTDTL
jgi:hypothetical protein